jgi:hypothetical protein
LFARWPSHRCQVRFPPESMSETMLCGLRKIIENKPLIGVDIGQCSPRKSSSKT